MYTAQDLATLKSFFDSLPRPLPNDILIYPGNTIRDTDKFLKTQFDTLNNGIGKPVFNTYFDRLYKLKEILETR